MLIGIFLLCFSMLWTGCKEDSDPVGVKPEKTGNVKFSLSKTTADEDVKKVIAVLTRSGYASSQKELVITGHHSASGKIDDIPVGLWQLLVEAKDTNEVVLYRGKADVEIKGNLITYVSINLSAVSSIGDLAINVSWNQSDGITWGKYAGNPVLINGSAGSWNSENVEAPFVLFDGVEYKMWFSGFDGTKTRIGLATSSDGINWTEYSNNPVLDTGIPGEWDQNYAYSPAVIYDGREYKMWYAGYDGNSVRIGLATSPDGINWTKYSGNPVLSDGTTGTWDDGEVLTRAVIFDGENYKMWFSGHNGNLETQIGYATSPDGTHWEKYSGNPVMSQTANVWDSFSVRAPAVIYDGVEYKMWYDGSNRFNRYIGYASSSDGITWNKEPDPVLLIGASGTWEDKSLYYPAVLFDQNKYKMWYTGQDSQGSRNYKIGYSTSP